MTDLELIFKAEKEKFDIDKATVEGLLNVDKALWEDEVKGIEEHYAKLGRVPAELQCELKTLKENLEK